VKRHRKAGIPHVGMGYFKSVEEAEERKQQYQQEWKEITCMVYAVYLFSWSGGNAITSDTDLSSLWPSPQPTIRILPLKSQ